MGRAPPVASDRSSSKAIGCGSWPGHGATGARRRTIDATGQGRRARLHRSPQPRRPGHPGRRPARAEGPPGCHDRGHRGRRQRVRAVRATGGSRGLRQPRRGPGRPAGPRLRLDLGGDLLARSTGQSASTSRRSSATRSSGSGRSAGTTSRPTSGRSTDARRLRDAMADGAFGLSSGLDYPPGSYATTAELAALTEEAGRHGGFYHTHVRYPAGRPLPRPDPRGDRHRPSRSAPAHVTHFYHRDTHPGGPEPLLALVDDARAEGLDVTFDTYPSEWASTRLLIQVRSGSRPAAPDRSRSGWPTVPPATGCGPSSRCAVRRTPAGPAGPTSVSGPSAGRRTCAGRAGRSPTSWPRPATTRSTSCATSCWPRTWASARSRAGRRRDAAAVRGAPGRDGRHGQHVPR